MKTSLEVAMEKYGMEIIRKYTIAVDFDGTLCNHEYPEIGAEREWLIETLKELRKSGHKLIMWTCRENLPDRGYLTEAVEFCKERGLEFDAVNENIVDYGGLGARKIVADLYLDDKSAFFDDITKMIKSDVIDLGKSLTITRTDV
jgi:hypothetical protein